MGRRCSAPHWRGNTFCSIPCSTPVKQTAKESHPSEQTDLNKQTSWSQRHSLLSLRSHTPLPPLQIRYHILSARTAARRRREGKWQSSVMCDSWQLWRVELWETYLGGPVKQTRASTFQKELFVVCDAAFRESPWVLDPEEREYWVIINQKKSVVRWGWKHGSQCCGEPCLWWAAGVTAETPTIFVFPLLWGFITLCVFLKLIMTNYSRCCLLLFTLYLYKFFTLMRQDFWRFY